MNGLANKKDVSKLFYLLSPYLSISWYGGVNLHVGDDFLTNYNVSIPDNAVAVGNPAKVIRYVDNSSPSVGNGFMGYTIRDDYKSSLTILLGSKASESHEVHAEETDVGEVQFIGD